MATEHDGLQFLRKRVLLSGFFADVLGSILCRAV